MGFYVRKAEGGVEMWLKRVTPFVTWGPREQALRFATRHEAIAACRHVGVEASEASIVPEAPDVSSAPHVGLSRA